MVPGRATDPLVEPRSARRALAGRLEGVAQPAPLADETRFRVSRRHRVRPRRRRLRRAAAATAAARGSRRRWRRLTAACIAWDGRTRSRLGLDGRLVGGLYGVAIGPRVLRRVDVHARHGRLEGRARPRRRLPPRSRHGNHRLPSRLRAYTQPRRRRHSARRVPAADRASSAPKPRRRKRGAPLNSAGLRLSLRLCNNAPPAGGSPTVAKWQKKKQFKWKVR